GLVVGDTFDLTLAFEKSDVQTVQFEVTEGMEHSMEEGQMEAGDMEHAMDGELEDGAMEHKGE
ncbi:MAG: hypothetical protein KDJ65_14655, partial [Anaerolineae bacterium]|nr:hypothetical protein [Anaerolineae bacterium]